MSIREHSEQSQRHLESVGKGLSHSHRREKPAYGHEYYGRGRDVDERILVYFKAAGDRQRTDALLDNLPIRYHNESFGEIRTSDHLYNPVACRLDCLNEASLVLSIDDHGPDPEVKPHKPSQKRYAAILTLHVGTRDFHCEEASISVDSDVTLTANHFHGSTKAPSTLRCIAFDRLSIDDDKSWTGLSL